MMKVKTERQFSTKVTPIGSRYINHFTKQSEIMKIWDGDDKKPTDDESEDEKPIFKKSNWNWIKIHQSFHKTISNH